MFFLIFGADRVLREEERDWKTTRQRSGSLAGVLVSASVLPKIFIREFTDSPGMEDGEDGGGGGGGDGYHRAAKRLRTEEDVRGQELEDGEEEQDSAGEEAARSGGTETRNRRQGGKVGNRFSQTCCRFNISYVCVNIHSVTFKNMKDIRKTTEKWRNTHIFLYLNVFSVQFQKKKKSLKPISFYFSNFLGEMLVRFAE